MRALISGIKRMEIHDGDGLRTTVFFKGCPLKCIWCHNPESISFGKEIAFFKNKCIHCDTCLSVCNENILPNRKPPFASCSFCLNCVDNCPTNALLCYGKEYELEELLSIVLQDESFFQNGQGGITLSGGECLSQPTFAIAFAKKLFEKGISVNIDTCGFVKQEILEQILPLVDTFLYDIKALDKDIHFSLTGKDNSIILDNLQYLSKNNAKIEIRYPLVMGYNDQECEKIAAFLSSLTIEKVKILQYHHFAESRYEALGRKNTMPTTVTTNEDIERCVQIFKAYNLVAINGAKS